MGGVSDLKDFGQTIGGSIKDIATTAIQEETSEFISDLRGETFEPLADITEGNNLNANPQAAATQTPKEEGVAAVAVQERAFALRIGGLELSTAQVVGLGTAAALSVLLIGLVVVRKKGGK